MSDDIKRRLAAMDGQEPSRREKRTSGQPWREPSQIPDELLPVKPFNASMLPVSLRDWIVDIAERLQCPADFPAVAAMIVLAGIVGRKIGIRPQRMTPWLVVPNLWGAVIGRPGIMKTPALQEPLKVLHRLEREAKSDFDLAMRDYETGCIISKTTRKVRETELKRAIKDKNGAEELARELQELDPAEPHRRRYVVNDSTVEKLGELLNQNPNGLTVYRDELVGFLKVFDKPGYENARSFYLEAWNGDGRTSVDRIGRGTLDIAASIVSIIGAIQPGPLSEYLLRQESGGAGDDGLLQRFQLAVYPDCPRAWQNVDRWPDSDAKRIAFAMYERLDRLEAVALSAEREDDEHVPFLRFDDLAQNLFDEWRAGLEDRVRSGTEHPAIESHLAKYRSLVPSLALLIHLADEPDGGPVTDVAIRMAIQWAEYLESHARRIYGSVSMPAIGTAHRLAARIKNEGFPRSFTLRDVYRKGWSGLTDTKRVAEAADVLVDYDWLRKVEVETEGRTGTVFEVNPMIFTSPRGQH